MVPQKTHRGVRNPAAVAAIANNPDVVDIVKDTLKQQQKMSVEAGKFLKNLLLLIGLSGVSYVGYKYYKKIRKQKYLENNLDNPNVQAAIIIHESILKITPPSLLKWFLPEIIWSVDENKILEVAEKTTSLQEVQKSYRIIFDEFFNDAAIAALNKDEYQQFLNIIKATEGPTWDEKTGAYPVYAQGDKLYAGLKGKTVKVLTVEYDETKPAGSKWVTYNTLYGNYTLNEKIGTVHYTAVKDFNGAKSRYYIVYRGVWPVYTYGIVWDYSVYNHQV